MPRPVALFTLLILPFLSLAQIRVTKLIVKPNEEFSLGQSDILVVDTLIMMDSSRIVLNKLKRENFIHAKVAIFGMNCVIDGKGVEGKPGRAGRRGSTPRAHARTAHPEEMAPAGLQGTSGVNLFLYLEEVRLEGKLIVDVSGGDGGPGGDGRTRW